MTIRNLVAIQKLHNINPATLAHILEEFLGLCEDINGYLCLSSKKFDGIVSKYISSEVYKIRADLTRLGIFLPAILKSHDLHPLNPVAWSLKKRSEYEHICIFGLSEYEAVRNVIKELRAGTMLPLLIYAYKVKRNEALIEWLNNVYAFGSITVKKAYLLLKDIVSQKTNPSIVDKLVPISEERFRNVFLKPLIKISENIIVVRNDVIHVDQQQFYLKFRRSQIPIQARVVLTLNDFLKAYIEYLKDNGWLRNWLINGGQSVNLYSLWKYKFKSIPWNIFLETVRRFANSTYGIIYTYYFIYEEERAHSVDVLVDVAKQRLGAEFEKIIAT